MICNAAALLASLSQSKTSNSRAIHEQLLSDCSQIARLRQINEPSALSIAIKISPSMHRRRKFLKTATRLLCFFKDVLHFRRKGYPWRSAWNQAQRVI